MEENNKAVVSIWGKWWMPIRKWFYSAWLIYETSYRFYDYAQSVHLYFGQKQAIIASYLGEIGAQTLDIFSSSLTFLICFAFLTIPTSFILFKFFDTDNLTRTSIERKMKRLL